MDAVMTQWAFGFGGWIGVIGGTFMFLTVPHNYTILLLLLSPWLGAIGLYLLMFATFSWMNICVQVASAMLKHEIVVALLTSCIGVLIVAIARELIDMERGHRTPAQAAAEESALPPSPASEPEAASDTASSEDSEDSDAETKSLDETVEETAESSSDDDESDDESDDEDDEKEESGEECGSGTDDSNSHQDEGDDADDEGGSADSDSSLNKARTDSSYENIQTPQLTALTTGNVSPIPTIPDV